MKSSWNFDIKTFNNVVERQAVKVTEKLANGVYDSLVDLSPVRQGQFRASWNMQVGSPDLSKVFGGTPENPLPKPKRPKLRGLSIKKLIYISNSHEYASLLEDGSSDQAPNGMVRITLARFK
jgi:hypothetical protein